MEGIANIRSCDGMLSNDIRGGSWSRKGPISSENAWLAGIKLSDFDLSRIMVYDVEKCEVN